MPSSNIAFMQGVCTFTLVFMPNGLGVSVFRKILYWSGRMLGKVRIGLDVFSPSTDWGTKTNTSEHRDRSNQIEKAFIHSLLNACTQNQV